jgi:cellulose synthase/poly-beta-1,6-N-acetylglucosamine synthase-like glycosyltransferase
MAARIAKGEVIAFLDDDASVDPEWLEQLERVFLRDPRIGLAGGAILNMACGRNDLVWRFMETVEKI